MPNPFTKKNKSDTSENSTTSIAKSWITGKLGSVIIGSAIGYSLYHFGIIKQITNYLTNLTKKTSDTPAQL